MNRILSLSLAWALRMCLLGLAANLAAADIPNVEQTLYPDADAWIEDGSFDNKGNQPEIRSGFEGKINYRALLHFDLSSLKKQPVRSAILRICSFNGDSNAKDVKFMRIQSPYRDWKELEVTWLQAEKGNYWHEKGGDILPQGFGGANMASDAGGGKDRWYCFDVTTLVQSWQSKVLPNYGLEIMNEPGSDIMLRIYSRESDKNRPHLLISYAAPIQPPEPTARAITDMQPLPVRPNYNPRIDTNFLNVATVGIKYELQLKASAGERPYKWEVQGKLPDGMSLSEDGMLTGTPTAAGSAQIRFKVTNANKRGSVTGNLKFTANPGAEPPPGDKPKPDDPKKPDDEKKPDNPLLPQDDG